MTTIYKDGQLIWSFDYSIANSNVVYFCYFPPYSYERHLNLLSKCSMAGATVKSLGHTLEGREIDCITIGTGPRIAWTIARQHPGETMAEYFAEGLLLRLLERSDAARELFTFHIVPNMCPDGSVRGHIRTNSCGANLNREWCSTGNYTVRQNNPNNTFMPSYSSCDSVMWNSMHCRLPIFPSKLIFYCLCNDDVLLGTYIRTFTRSLSCVKRDDSNGSGCFCRRAWG